MADVPGLLPQQRRDEPSPSASDLRAAIAAAGLPGSLHRIDSELLDDDACRALVRIAEEERLSGILLAAIHDGQVRLGEAAHQALVASHRRLMASTLLLERAMLECVAALEDRGIEVRVLKGSAVARLDYPNLSQRAFGDVDVMVRPQQFAEAVKCLSDVGFRRQARSISAAYDRRFGKGATLVGPDGTQIDLHRTFVVGRYGLTVDLDEAWERPQSFGLAGRTLYALSPEARLLHAAYHAVLGGWPPRVVPFRDVAEMALYGTWDGTLLRRMSRGWRAEAVLATAVRESWELLRLEDATALSTWAAHYEVVQRDRQALDLHRTRKPSYTARQLAAVRVLPWRERLPFALALAVPSKEFLESRGTSRRQHLRRAVARGLRQ